MTILDLNQASTSQFMNPRSVWSERITQATDFFAIGHIEDLMHGNQYAEKNTFPVYVSFVLTLSEAEGIIKGTSLRWKKCYAPTLDDAMNCIHDRNSSVLSYLESYAKECGCEFRQSGNGIAIDHYVQQYQQKQAA